MLYVASSVELSTEGQSKVREEGGSPIRAERKAEISGAELVKQRYKNKAKNRKNS